MADNTPMNNLTQNKMGDTSLKPGVSGESVNAPWGPKAEVFEDIESLKAKSDRFNHGGVK